MAQPPIYTGTQENSPNTTHSAGNFQGYLPKPGQLFIGANKFQVVSGFTYDRLGVGLASQRLQVASGIMMADLAQILSQTILPALPPQGGGKAIYTQNNNGQTMGISISKVQALYFIQGANLTSGSIGITQTVWPADNTATAPVITAILAPTSLALPLRANIYNTTYTPAVQTMLATANSEILIEVAAVAPASSTMDFYGVIVNLQYNY